MESGSEKQRFQSLEGICAWASGDSDEGVVVFRFTSDGEIVRVKHPYAEGIGKRRVPKSIEKDPDDPENRPD